MVVAEVALLDILGDGVVGLLGGDLHLGLGHLGDLDDHVVAAVALEGDVVPGADGGTALALEVEAEGFRGVLAGLLGGDRVEGGGQGTGRGAARGGEGRGSGGGGSESEEGGDGGEAHVDVQGNIGQQQINNVRAKKAERRAAEPKSAPWRAKQRQLVPLCREKRDLVPSNTSVAE